MKRDDSGLSDSHLFMQEVAPLSSRVYDQHGQQHDQRENKKGVHAHTITQDLSLAL